MRRESAALQKLESQLASLQYASHLLTTMPCPSLLTSFPENLTFHCKSAMIGVPADDSPAGLPRNTMKRSFTPASSPAGKQRMRTAQPELVCRVAKTLRGRSRGCRPAESSVFRCARVHSATPGTADGHVPALPERLSSLRRLSLATALLGWSTWQADALCPEAWERAG